MINFSQRDIEYLKTVESKYTKRQMVVGISK